MGDPIHAVDRVGHLTYIKHPNMLHVILNLLKVFRKTKLQIYEYNFRNTFDSLIYVTKCYTGLPSIDKTLKT